MSEKISGTPEFGKDVLENREAAAGRVKSDFEKLKGGAKYVGGRGGKEPRLQFTEEQVESALREGEYNKRLDEAKDLADNLYQVEMKPFPELKDIRARGWLNKEDDAFAHVVFGVTVDTAGDLKKLQRLALAQIVAEGFMPNEVDMAALENGQMPIFPRPVGPFKSSTVEYYFNVPAKNVDHPEEKGVRSATIYNQYGTEHHRFFRTRQKSKNGADVWVSLDGEVAVRKDDRFGDVALSVLNNKYSNQDEPSEDSVSDDVRHVATTDVIERLALEGRKKSGLSLEEWERLSSLGGERNPVS